ncbi:MAG: HAMP domain-containing histidine kinase [Actinobacteria bacterium]|nr:HAMP domain-containing histidine kinase [Actinomycetota bacterium]
MKLRWKLFLAFLAVIAVVIAVVAVLVRRVSVGAVSSHMDGMMTGGGMMGGMMTDLEQAVSVGVTEALLVGALAGLVVAAVVSYVVSGYFIRTIGVMAGAARRIADGEYGQRVSHSADDEIGEFADAFNEMAAQLDDTERVRRELLATISHELRTPLTSIQGYMEGLMDGVVPEEPETYQLVHREAARLSRLVADLERVSRVEAGAERIVLEVVNVAKILTEVADRLRPQFEQKPLALAIEVAGGTPPVLADDDKLVQSLMNVAVNAFKFTPPGGRVVFRGSTVQPGSLTCPPIPERAVRALAASGTPMVLLQVQDDGIGIPEEDLPHVFERFYRVDKSRSSAGGGLGIGLAVTRGLIEQMGGVVWVMSGSALEADPGMAPGTTVSILLPSAQPA